MQPFSGLSGAEQRSLTIHGATARGTTFITSIGDLNADGIDDFAISDQIAEQSRGRVYVIFGATELNMNFELDQVGMSIPGIIISGNTIGDLIGQSVAGPGDINGDGIDDLAFGGLTVSQQSNAFGPVYVLFGQPDLDTRIDAYAIGSSVAGLILDEREPLDQAGISISSVGDFNNDGVVDLLIGSRLSDVNGAASGQSYILFGQADMMSGRFSLADIMGSLDGLTINGATAGDTAGIRTGGAGDFNGDGCADVLIAAPGAQSAQATNGIAYLVYGCLGRNEPLELSALSADSLGVTFSHSLETSGLLNLSVAGDVNNDGFTDILIAFPTADNETVPLQGQVYLVFGSATLAGDVQLDSLVQSGRAVSMAGEFNFSQLGTSLSPLGDLDNDGFDDFAISSSFGLIEGERASRVYLLNGSAEIPAELELGSLGVSATGRTFSGSENLSIGLEIAGDLDVNADGVNDLLFGTLMGGAPGTRSEFVIQLLFGQRPDFDRMLPEIPEFPKVRQ